MKLFKNNKIFLIIFILFILCLICKSCDNREHFYLWNIPTRWNKPIYDIRGYPWLSEQRIPWVFIHNGRVYDSKYIDINKYPDLYYYLPYYNNGMIYMANGKYTYNTFSKYYNLPILYQIPYDNIDWIGLVNNGIINQIE
jgi:hypothetical protein